MKKVINTTSAPKAIGPYSQAVEVNNMLFVSGQIPVNPIDGSIPGDIVEQTKQVLDNLIAILSAAGYTLDHVVKCTCLLSDMENFQAFNTVYAQYFTKEPPARAAYGVVKLPLGVLVEIEAIAVK
ncbi:MAG: RidA family protein [Bacteroidales bacterium]|jgi:2-iminobutanoate/2-iminopropanoate deaminase|nr:RidA family protein [Bacteroidales bacterium]